MPNSYTPSALSLPVPGQVATHGSGPEPWPKRQPGRAPTGRYLVPRGERKREGGLCHIPGWGAPRAFPGQKRAPSGHRARQGRANPGRSSSRSSSLMTAVFCCTFPSCSGREAAWGGGGEDEGGGEEEGSKQKTTERASSLRSENTSRLRSPVGGCMCGNETGRGRERGNKQ